MEQDKNPIKSYKDLMVYQRSYAAMLVVIKNILPKFPQEEKYDLLDQLRRSSKAIPRLIAEGYAKRHQKAGFQKYLDDAPAECNETQVGLDQTRDLYNIEPDLTAKYAVEYNDLAKMIYSLRNKWTDFKNNRNNSND